MAMSVPRYNEPQVQEAALPGVRQSSVASPELLGAGGDRQIQQGNRMMEAGSELNQVAIKMQHEEDLRTVQGAVAQYTEGAQNFTLDAKDKRTGAGAAGLVGDFDKFHTETSQKILEGLHNETQKRAFAAQVARSRLAVRQDLGTFEINQGKLSTDANFKAVTDSQIGAAAAAGTPEAAAAFKDPLMRNVRAYAATRNMTPEQEQALLSSTLTQFHAQRIQQLVSDPKTAASAKDYFENNKAEIDGKQWAELGGFAKKGAATATGNDVATTVWTDMGPKAGTDEIKTYDMEERIRKELKGDDLAIESAIKNLRERETAFKTQRVEEAHKAQASVNQLVMKGAGLTQLRSSPEFIMLSQKDPKAARDISEFVENKQIRGLQRANALSAQADAAEVRADRRLHRDTMDVTLQVSDPTVLAGLSREQVTNLLPKLGIESTQFLLNRWEQYHKSGDALSEAKIDDQQFKSFAQRAGVDITPKSNDDAGKERLINLRDDVERIIGSEQQAKKRALTREEKDVILQRVIDDKVIQHNIFSRDQAVPALALPKSEQDSAYVMVGDKKVVMSQIPAEERSAIVAARKKAGLPVTQQGIAEYWIRKQQLKTNNGK